MGPILICDKSSLQALNPKELNALRRYYSLNIPPVLSVEILGDLKKHSDPKAGQNEVRILANKLMPANSVVNTNFRLLIEGELSGHKFPMDGRPVLTGGKNMTGPDGKNGIIFEQSAEADALLRWQTGEFNEAEKLMADAWRTSTAAIDLEGMQRHLRGKYSGKLKLQTLPDTAQFVGDLMASNTPKVLLTWFLNDNGMFGDKAVLAVEKFKDASAGSLHAHAPYTAYCVRTALIFYFAVTFGLVSTRPTNRVDLEYLYYVPFCNAFSSGDNFHRKTAPLVVRDQVFADRDILKADLKRLAEWWDKLSADERKHESDFSGPPKNEESLTHQLWQRVMKKGYRERSHSEQKLSPDVSAKLLKQAQSWVKEGVPTDKTFNDSMDECDFMVFKHMVRLDGPCICNSGKMFKDCCGSKLDGRAK